MADDKRDGIAVVYPSNWPEEDLEAHCTVIYLGKVDEVDFKKKDVHEALRSAGLQAPGSVRTKGLAKFGPEEDINVVLIDSAMVSIQKKLLQVFLLLKGIKDASEFTDYKPHITISDPDIEIPPRVSLGAPVLWWGPQS